MEKRRLFNPGRVVSIVASVLLTVAFVSSLFLNGDPLSIIPHTEIVIPIIHAISLVLALFCIIKPEFKIQFAIMQLESVLTIVTNYEHLGIFFFWSSVFLLTVLEYPNKKISRLLFISLFFHILSLIGVYPHGIEKTIIAAVSSVFYGSIFFWIYEVLKIRFSCFTPAKVSENSTISKLPKGAVLNLSDYKLSERQINFVLDNITNNLSLKDLSEKYYVSISTVKKEFREMYQIFGVTKLEELHLLLMQYQIKK